ncbi:lytic transglycosylase domain-containing protein [Neiella sp. HB171785]|uniref:Lytic transglycosylase domain-containing protein n=1 Tax=Neiella litorisoli TaxID=2771431 RepID=A0A8J6UIZ4_9GAMM|nr:lytic transglycosylase domain-containing protein [Neiella litorisoli]MBD1389538.1 lytic transglycosylase domain-containing protein [Neiella litorisoli]
MIDMLLALGVEPYEPNPQIMERCIEQHATAYEIPPAVAKAMLMVEGGRVGTIKANTNGTYDLGVAQINTMNLPLIQQHFPDIDAKSLVFDPCASIQVSMWFLDRKIQQRDGSLWEGVGDYNSRTPRVRVTYLYRVMEAYQQVVLYEKSYDW